jgi:flagellar biosynthesis GTPase FlhF
LGNGQTFAIAGLLNNQVNSTLQKIPGIGDIPILGQLFRSRAAQKQQTELVVMITPQILPNNSVGVTGQLPRLQEPYLPPMPDDRTLAAPGPAFQSLVPGAGVAPVGPGGTVASGSPSSASPVMSDSERRAVEARMKEEAATEKKRLEAEAKRQRDEAKRQEAEAKRLQAEEAKRQKAELKRQQEEARQLQRFIDQQAKQQAEDARRLAEIEKKQKEAAGSAGSR